ncbi:MAG: ligase-associated DNA damage response exonuclease [Bacteroidia bacterium]
MALLTFTERGIYCPQADVYIDPWRPVARAVITHGHSDHARKGMQHYLTQHKTVPIIQHRLGAAISVEGRAFGERVHINGVEISLHPAGHIVGSAQVRLSYKGETWVVSGDYKIQDDGVATPFEAVKCHAFITESTFGLPIYRWQPQAEVIGEINDWWQQNANEDRASLLIGYSLGKAQRLLENIDHSIGPIYTHGAVENMQEVLRAHGVALKPTLRLTSEIPKSDFRKALIVAPMSAIGSSWAKQLEPYSLGIASGWMKIRGARRRRAADRGFVLSDHADWDGLNAAIEATEAEKVFVTHGYTDIFSKWLNEQGIQAGIVKTEFAENDDP